MGAPPAPPQPATTSHAEGQGGTHSVKHGSRLCSVPVALRAKESSNEGRMSFPLFFFFSKALKENLVRMTMTYSPAEPKSH